MGNKWAGPPKHGTYTRYRSTVYRCRCEECKAAHRTYERERRTRALERGSLTHGRQSTYDAGCRCEPCTAMKAANDAARRPRKRPPRIPKPEPEPLYADPVAVDRALAFGTGRELNKEEKLMAIAALIQLGYPRSHIIRQVGTSTRTIQKVQEAA